MIELEPRCRITCSIVSLGCSSSGSRSEPVIKLLLNPIRKRNSANVSALADQINEGPMFFTLLLKMIKREPCDLASSQPAGKKNGEHSPVAFTLHSLAIRRLPEFAKIRVSHVRVFRCSFCAEEFFDSP